MTQRFHDFIGFVIDHEGRAYENDKDDPGNFTPSGELKGTKYGIDSRSHPDVDIKNLTEEAATEIYFSEWEGDGCEILAPKLGESHFDACVNTGAGRANKFLQASRGDPAKYNDQRDAFYYRLAAARPSSQKYLRGWLNRTKDLRKFLNI